VGEPGPDATGLNLPAAEEKPRDENEQESKPAVENRWWVDTGTATHKPSTAKPAAPVEEGTGRPVRVVGERLFRAGRGFDQDRARARLTGSNLNWIREANPPEDGWAYLAPTESRSRDDMVARVKSAVRLPSGARAVLIDSGTSLRVVATGTPVGERMVELTIGGESSFDAWVGEDWVCERVYRNRDRALREASGLLARYLGPPR
jgi:hypothetical protein